MEAYKGIGKCCSEEEWVGLYRDLISITSGSSSVNKLSFASSLLDDIKDGLCVGGMRPRCKILGTLMDAMSFQLAKLEQKGFVNGDAKEISNLTGMISKGGEANANVDDNVSLLSGSETTDDEAGVFSDRSTFKQQHAKTSLQSPNLITPENIVPEVINRSCTPPDGVKSSMPQTKPRSSSLNDTLQKRHVWFDPDFKLNKAHSSKSVTKQFSQERIGEVLCYEDKKSNSVDGIHCSSRQALKRSNDQRMQSVAVKSSGIPIPSINPPMLHLYSKASPSENISSALRKLKSRKTTGVSPGDGPGGKRRIKEDEDNYSEEADAD